MLLMETVVVTALWRTPPVRMQTVASGTLEGLSVDEKASRLLAPHSWRSRGWHHMRKREGRERNLAMHKDEIAESRRMGFAPVAGEVLVDRPGESWHVPREALGMGRSCPFVSDELVFAARDTLSPSECNMLREEADRLLGTGAQYTYTLASAVREVAVHELPVALEWFNTVGLPRLTSLATQCFSSAAVSPKELWVYDALIIKYDADAFEMPHTPVHRDSSLITCANPVAHAKRVASAIRPASDSWPAVQVRDTAGRAGHVPRRRDLHRGH